MPKCKVNGKEVEVPEGTKLIEAFKKANEEIAHYCYHSGLSVAGCCRLCMVEVEGAPRPQIACNTVVTEGMSATNQTEQIKETVKWGLDFHLINHPLDCPICDQAGECELQNQYMKFGQGYDSEMAEKKVKKHKVVDLGKEVVLDSERCVLCSRCVRFTDEITKTHELGIFNRGDRSEVGTFKGKTLDNNYSVNTVDICPVGALTSKDFRFNQRVWYLKNKKTICTGCSTGCHVKAYYNEEGYFRMKPVYTEDVNGYWMCDEGRKVYKSTNLENRNQNFQIKDQGEVQQSEALSAFSQIISDTQNLGIVITGQQTNEEYDAFFNYLKSKNNSLKVFHWNSSKGKEEDFDGLLMRGDKSPNTKGLLNSLDKNNLTATNDLSQCESVETLIVVAPENLFHVDDLEAQVKNFSKNKNFIFIGASRIESLSEMATVQIPLKTYLEKSGTFTNYQGKEQKVNVVKIMNKKALSLLELTQTLNQQSPDIEKGEVFAKVKTNFFVSQRGTL